MVNVRKLWRGMRLSLWLGLVVALMGGVRMVAAEEKTAVFAGGCFWCMQSEFNDLKGVLKTTVGYTGGDVPDPTYEQVSAGGTGHFEALEVIYDADVVTYERLLEVFWSNIDPLDAKGQFCDQGEQYRAAIFVSGEAERKAAEASKAAMSKKLNAEVVTLILPRKPFYAAEEHHQQYSVKNPLRYSLYRQGCARDGRLEELKKQAGAPEK